MTWLHAALIAFATFTAWEWLAVALPFSLPAWLQPLAVVGIAYGAQQLPAPWLLALAAAGAVALLHTFVRGGLVEAPALRIPRSRTARPGRVPDLP